MLHAYFRLLTRKRSASTVYLWIEGCTALFYTLVFTVSSLYQVTQVGLNPLQLVLVGTMLEVTVFVFEVPTGVVADAYSRRLSVIIGLLLTGAGFLLEGSIARFETILLAQVLWGLGATFISGANTAWIADELGEERAGRAFVRGAQVGQVGWLVGVPISVVFGTVDVTLPILLGGVSFILLALVLAVIMPENGFTPTAREDRTTWGTLAHTFREGWRLVRGRPLLLIILGIAAFHGLASEGFDRLYTPHFLDNFNFPAEDRIEPVVWFGIISATTAILSIIGNEIVRRRVNTSDPQQITRVLLAVNTGIVLAMLIFALAGHFALALIAFLAVRTGRRVSEPLQNAWINPQLDSSVRATVFSMTAQVDAIGQIAGGPGVGVVGAQLGLRSALATSAMILSPVVILFAAARRHTRNALALASADLS